MNVEARDEALCLARKAEELRKLEERVQRDEALLRQALEALEFFRDTAICEADTAVATEAIAALHELDWLDGDMGTCDHSVGVCMCSYWSTRRKMKAALANGAAP